MADDGGGDDADAAPPRREGDLDGEESRLEAGRVAGPGVVEAGEVVAHRRAAERAHGVVDLGEVAAACAAGALTVDDGVRVMCVRSAFLSKLRGCGAMAVLGVDVDGARALIDDLSANVSVAVNNASSTRTLEPR